MANMEAGANGLLLTLLINNVFTACPPAVSGAGGLCEDTQTE